MKALSLYNPWAALVANGTKTIETRSWSTRWRGPLAIHASKRTFGFNSQTAEAIGSWPRDAYVKLDDAVNGDPMLGDNYPRGVIVATCTLVDVLPVVFECEQENLRRVASDVDGSLWLCEPEPDEDSQDYPTHDWRDISDERPFGDFTPGRFAWLLEDIVALPEPIPAKGHQGLWNWEGSLCQVASS